MTRSQLDRLSMSTLTAMEGDGADDPVPVTAEGLLRRRARQRAGATALIDPPNRQALTFAAPHRLTYADADAAVDTLAARFVDFGLKPGDRVVAQLPNLAEMPLTLLGAWRAGLTVAAIPMLWRAGEIARVCDSLEPAALIGISRYGEEAPAERLRDVAATRPKLRLVLGFGPNLPAGVGALDDAMAPARANDRPQPRMASNNPALVTFTARERCPIVPLFRAHDEILAQGAMAVLSRSLDQRDVILNAYPLTGPVGLGCGLAPWLISGAALVQHDPFDYRVLVEQIRLSGATMTALPGSVLQELSRDGVFKTQDCRLRRVGRVWSVPELIANATTDDGDRTSFDLYPLGDLASVITTPEDNADRASLPRGSVYFGDAEDRTAFVETKVADLAQDICVRGPVVPTGLPTGPMAKDGKGFVATGLYGEARYRRIRVRANPGLIHHGGFTIAMSELDGLYQAFPGYLDAACFTLPDPVVGDRIFGAVAPAPEAPVSLEALHGFLRQRGVAPYKFPDKLLVVRAIPRRMDGEILRQEILQQI